LHTAARFNSARSNLLSKAGADLSARIADECTPLHLAARHNTYTAVTKMLLDLRSAVDSREVNEWTLLHLAARYWCGGVRFGLSSDVKKLISQSADVTTKGTASVPILNTTFVDGVSEDT